MTSLPGLAWYKAKFIFSDVQPTENHRTCLQEVLKAKEGPTFYKQAVPNKMASDHLFKLLTRKTFDLSPSWTLQHFTLAPNSTHLLQL